MRCLRCYHSSILVAVVLHAFFQLQAATTAAAAETAKNALRRGVDNNLNHLQHMCDRIHPDQLPQECVCHEPRPYSLVVECVKPFDSEYFNDTIGMKIDIDPCNDQGSSMSIDVIEKDHNIDFQLAGIRAGEAKNVPIPGLGIIVPGVGHLGVDVAVLIAGNPDKLIMKVGLNACLGVGPKTMCASSVPGLDRILPWYVLHGEYSFGDICSSNSTATAATVTTTATAME